MIVYEGEGSLFDTRLQTITAPVNTVGVMGNGLALAMKQRVRGLFDFYKDLCDKGELKVGQPQLYKIPKSRHQVLLFPTKTHWKNPSKTEYVIEGLDYLVANYKEMGITELGLPPLGCGYGGLDYIKFLRPLLHEKLADIDLPVHIYLYNRIL